MRYTYLATIQSNRNKINTMNDRLFCSAVDTLYKRTQICSENEYNLKHALK